MNRWVQHHCAAARLNVVDNIMGKSAQVAWNRSWTERDQRNEIAVDQRESYCRAVVHAVPYRRVICFHGRNRRGYRDGVRSGARLQFEIEATLLICRDVALAAVTVRNARLSTVMV